MFCTFWLPKVLFATAARNFAASDVWKVLRNCRVLHIFTSTCAFRHSGVHFFDIRTSKSALGMRCFVHFHFRIYLSPQGRAFFQHQNLQKWSKHVMFCTCSLPNVLFTTAACNFSTSALTKVVQTRHVLYIFTSECAFRHRCVHFFSTSARTKVVQTRHALYIFTSECAFRHSGVHFFRRLKSKKCFGADVFCTFSLQNVLFTTAACNFWFIRWPPDSAPAALTGLLFDWPDKRIIEKTQHFVTSLTFSADVSSFTWLWHYCIFCRLTWLLYCCAFHRLFNSPYCRKFLFKLPSIRHFIMRDKLDLPPHGPGNSSGIFIAFLFDAVRPLLLKYSLLAAKVFVVLVRFIF